MVKLALSEVDRLKSWMTAHKMGCIRGPFNGFITITQTNDNGIGVNTWVECDCGRKDDITDYSIW